MISSPGLISARMAKNMTGLPPGVMMTRSGSISMPRHCRR
jgi:hypothetical protein